MKSLIIFLIITGVFLSCKTQPPENCGKLIFAIDSLEKEILLIKMSKDSVMSELSLVKKAYGIGIAKNIDAKLLSKYKLELSRAKTGYIHSNYDALFLPAITLEFRNISNLDLTDRIVIKFVFINNKKSEQLYESTVVYCEKYRPLVGGLVKQVAIRSGIGWMSVQNQNVSVRLYINDDFWKQYKIKNIEYLGRI